jgi:hypothetical protein
MRSHQIRASLFRDAGKIFPLGNSTQFLKETKRHQVTFSYKLSRQCLIRPTRIVRYRERTVKQWRNPLHLAADQ